MDLAVKATHNNVQQVAGSGINRDSRASNARETGKEWITERLTALNCRSSKGG